jgi:hypothetical protein
VRGRLAGASGRGTPRHTRIRVGARNRCAVGPGWDDNQSVRSSQARTVHRR